MAQAVQPQESRTPSAQMPAKRFRFEWRWTDGFWVLGLILLILGIPSMWQRFSEGLAPTNLTSYVPWGVWVGFYDYLVWMEVGSLLIFTSMVYLFGDRLMPKIKPVVLFVGFVVVTMGLLIVLLDLGHPERFWHVIVYPDFGSMIAWMVWLHSTYLLILVLELALVLWGGSRLKFLLKPLAYISLPAGLALIIVSGSIFGVVAARPLWNTASLPLMFLLSALAAGSGLLLLVIVIFWQDKQSEEYVRSVRRLSLITRTLLIAGVFAAGVIAFTMLYKGGGNPTRAEALNLILTGPYWWSFWIVHVLLGVLIPLALLFIMPGKPVIAGIAAFLSSITFVAVTLNIVIPTLITEELKGLSTAFVDAKLSLDYAPNLMEWLVLAFVFGMGSFILGMGLRFLPLQSHHAEESHA